jgi:hypothetical protein
MEVLYILGIGILGVVVGIIFMVFFISVAFRSFILEPWNAPPSIRQAIRAVIDRALQACQAVAHEVQSKERCSRECGEKIASAIGDIRLDVWERAFNRKKVEAPEDETEEVESEG